MKTKTHDPCSAGDGREPPLKYTAPCAQPLPDGRWGWPGTAAQVHLRQAGVQDADSWGWPGTAAQVHLTTYNLMRRSRLYVVFVFRKEVFALEYLLERVVFYRRKPPFCRIDGLSQRLIEPVPGVV